MRGLVERSFPSSPDSKSSVFGHAAVSFLVFSWRRAWNVPHNSSVLCFILCPDYRLLSKPPLYLSSIFVPSRKKKKIDAFLSFVVWNARTSIYINVFLSFSVSPPAFFSLSIVPRPTLYVVSPACDHTNAVLRVPQCTFFFLFSCFVPPAAVPTLYSQRVCRWVLQASCICLAVLPRNVFFSSPLHGFKPPSATVFFGCRWRTRFFFLRLLLLLRTLLHLSTPANEVQRSCFFFSRFLSREYSPMRVLSLLVYFCGRVRRVAG